GNIRLLHRIGIEQYDVVGRRIELRYARTFDSYGFRTLDHLIFKLFRLVADAGIERVRNNRPIAVVAHALCQFRVADCRAGHETALDGLPAKFLRKPYGYIRAGSNTDKVGWLGLELRDLRGHVEGLRLKRHRQFHVGAGLLHDIW